MSADIFEKLRRHFDRFPAGFPATEEKYEIKILKSFFSGEEAQYAINLPFAGSDYPKDIRPIVDQMGKDEDEAERILDSMVEKGLVYRSIDDKGSKAYALLPFVPGIIEFSAKKLDHELAQVLEKYLYGAFGREMMKPKIPLVKVIPIRESIPSEIIVSPYENILTALEESSSLCVMDCICRTQKNLIGEGCGRPVETCMFLNEFAEHANEIGMGRKVTKEEAIEILRKAEDAGCIHCVNNSQRILGICSCCGCCCQPLKLLITTNNPGAVAKSGFIVTIDSDLCSGCEACVDRCWFDALKMGDEYVMLDRDRCIGCGGCIRVCPEEALSLQAKPADEIMPVPKDQFELFNEMGWRK